MQAGYRKGAELAEQRSQVHIFMAQTVGIHLSCCVDHRQEATNVPRTADHLKARIGRQSCTHRNGRCQTS